MVNNGTNEDTAWPMPKFQFEVDLGNGMTNIMFAEAKGLDVVEGSLEYRNSDSNSFTNTTMPGMSKHGSVTLKRGVFQNHDAFFGWYDRVKMNTLQRTSVSIKLMDEQGTPTIQWTLKDAWITKISSPEMTSGSEEIIIIDTLELAHAGLTVNT